MPYFEFVWDHRPGKNVEHIGEHGVTPGEAEFVVKNPYWVGPNRRRPGRMFAKGLSPTGRRLGVSYSLRPDGCVEVITAFDLE